MIPESPNEGALKIHDSEAPNKGVWGPAACGGIIWREWILQRRRRDGDLQRVARSGPENLQTETCEHIATQGT